MPISDSQRRRLYAKWMLFQARTDASVRQRVKAALRLRFKRWLDRTLEREVG